MNSIREVQKNILVRYHKISEEQSEEIINMLEVLGLKLSDVYINKNSDPISISLNYHFYISKAIESGELKNLKVWVKNDRAYVVVNRDGIGEFKFSLHKREVERGNQNWQSMPETMLKKTAIKRALKLIFADLYSTYEIINLPSNKKEQNKNQEAKTAYQQDYSKKIANSYSGKSNPSYNQQKTKEETQEISSSEQTGSEISKIRKEIFQIRIKNNISEEEFNSAVREAKDIIFSDPNYKLSTEHDYVRLKNFLEKKYTQTV
ncbi:MAG: recombinase RecT [Candidatus Dojkabacteria bacterium]|nr:recombinase RecT [Candidatus Dojkabacteria bacterium]